MASGRYEITKNGADEFSFSLVTLGGRTIAKSGKYRSLGVCKKGIASLRINSDAPIEDKTESFSEETGETGLTGVKMCCPKIELVASGGAYNFYVLAKNGSIIAEGEGYGTKNRCLEAIAKLKYIAFSAENIERF